MSPRRARSPQGPPGGVPKIPYHTATQRAGWNEAILPANSPKTAPRQPPNSSQPAPKQPSKGTTFLGHAHLALVFFRRRQSTYLTWWGALLLLLIFSSPILANKAALGAVRTVQIKLKMVEQFRLRGAPRMVQNGSKTTNERSTND